MTSSSQGPQEGCLCLLSVELGRSEAHTSDLPSSKGQLNPQVQRYLFKGLTLYFIDVFMEARTFHFKC